MELPVPTHLKDIFFPVGNDNNEFEVTGEIKCSCGNEYFEIWESNEQLMVKILCKQCKKEYVIFDSGKHGWNGFVCGDDFLNRELPYNKYHCSNCKEDCFKVLVHISSQGKEDFIDECLSTDDSFSVEDWVDAFEWISISLTCENCGELSKEWLDAETM
ncbi:MAG: hypothetical protein IJO97_04280 [Lachnospiraceae bacterium]|nr:hypothetical protein [Lachnospiraceae bacterium]